MHTLGAVTFLIVLEIMLTQVTDTARVFIDNSFPKQPSPVLFEQHSSHAYVPLPPAPDHALRHGVLTRQFGR